MVLAEAPTGNEEVQKYYASPYLDEIDKFKVAFNNAIAAGQDPQDIEGFDDIHPVTIAAVAPSLLRPDQQEELNKYAVISPDFPSGPAGTTHIEANGDEDKRVEYGLDVKKLDDESKLPADPNDPAANGPSNVDLEDGSNENGLAKSDSGSSDSSDNSKSVSSDLSEGEKKLEQKEEDKAKDPEANTQPTPEEVKKSADKATAQSAEELKQATGGEVKAEKPAAKKTAAKK